jgi:hypothetical protein
MKKISLIALALCTSAALFAQDQPQLRTEVTAAPRFGIKGGVNIAKFNTDEAASGFDVHNKTSMHGGLFVNLPAGASGFAIQPELLYNGMGAKVTQTLPLTGTTRYEQDMHYLSLPVMFQWRSQPGFYIELGPQASYLLKATADMGDQGDHANKDQFDKFDISAAGGIGFTSRMGLGVGARYLYGLSNVYEDNGTANGPELKHRVLQVGLFYQFGAAK